MFPDEDDSLLSRPGPPCCFQVKDHDGGCPGARCVPALRDQPAGRQQRNREFS